MKDESNLDQNSTTSPSSQTPISVQVGSKETASAALSEFVKPSEQTKSLDREVAEAGVQQVAETPNLDKEHEQIGVKHSDADTPVQTEPTGAVSLPMTNEKAESIMKEYKNKVTVDVGQHGEEQAYVIPSKLGLATLVHKINQLFGFLRRRPA